MYPVKRSLSAVTASAMLLSGSILFQTAVHAAPATYDGATTVVDIPEVDLHSTEGVSTWSAQLKLVPGTNPVALELVTAAPANSTGSADRTIYFSDTEHVHFPSVQVGGQSFYAKLKVIPGSNPLRFELVQLADNADTACPSFAAAGAGAGTCVLSGEINQDVTLTSGITWEVTGSVYVGGDNANSATLTINPGTKIIGQQGADFLWIRRGSKIMAEGTPNQPIIMTGPLSQSAGEWGGLVLAGNAPVNGCTAGVDPCEIAFEAIATEKFGGNNPADNSGLLKYVQINYAGFAVRPDEELNGLTMNGVGSGTVVDYVQVHQGLDDGVEMFGGTVQMKHLVLTEIGDDSLDWGQGWTGKAQFVLIKQSANDGDRGIEADNNEDDNDASPRAKPMLSNITALGSPVSSQGALLRRGTGVNIYNSVFKDFGEQCLRIDGESTYDNAGSPGSLTGELTIVNSYVDCATNFNDDAAALFLVSDWFTSQAGNVEGDPQLSGFLPGSGSPLLTGGSNVADPFFTPVSYIGAFKDSADDWTQEWTTGM